MEIKQQTVISQTQSDRSNRNYNIMRPHTQTNTYTILWTLFW